jgi:hypothetical protein
MLYFARVVDNRNFGSTGTIEVFIPQKNVENGFERYFQKDLKEIYTNLPNLIACNDENTWSTKYTFSCLVTSPFSNGYNTGSFALPQINTIGLVMEIDNKEFWSSYRYVWLGGLYGCKMYGNDILLPNDDTVSDSFDYEDKALQTINSDNDEDNISGKDIIKNGQFIIKTKVSRVTDFNNITEEQIDFEKIPSDNTFVMDKNKITFRHNGYSSESKKNSISDILLDNNSIIIKRFAGESDDKRKEQTITINDKDISITFDNKTDSKKVVLSFDAEGNTKLETTGNVKVHSEGDMSFDTDKKLTIHSKDNLSIQSDAIAKIISSGKMKIEGSGVDLGRHMSNMSKHYISTNTIGGPTNQALAPGSIINGNEDVQEAIAGFIL